MLGDACRSVLAVSIGCSSTAQAGRQAGKRTGGQPPLPRLPSLRLLHSRFVVAPASAPAMASLVSLMPGAGGSDHASSGPRPALEERRQQLAHPTPCPPSQGAMPLAAALDHRGAWPPPTTRRHAIASSSSRSTGSNRRNTAAEEEHGTAPTLLMILNQQHRRTILVIRTAIWCQVKCKRPSSYLCCFICLMGAALPPAPPPPP